MSDDSPPADKIKELLLSQPFGVLSTKGEYPHTSLISFWSSEDFGRLVFITSRNTRKYRNLMKDPRAAIMVDDRTNNPSADLKQASSVMITGTVKEATATESESLRELFLERNPDQLRFSEESDSAVMVMKVEGTDLVTSFQV